MLRFAGMLIIPVLRNADYTSRDFAVLAIRQGETELARKVRPIGNIRMELPLCRSSRETGGGKLVPPCDDFDCFIEPQGIAKDFWRIT